ncbi:MAG: FAD-dependent oxidoreductase, partial [Aeromicrobium sp.]
YTGDATDTLIDQIERFAPGVRERIVATSVRPPALLHAENANYVGGDITGGAGTPWQTVFRPRVSHDPYRLGDGLFLCSASTPPGGGVHGMAGFHAAESVLRSL